MGKSTINGMFNYQRVSDFKRYLKHLKRTPWEQDVTRWVKTSSERNLDLFILFLSCRSIVRSHQAVSKVRTSNAWEDRIFGRYCQPESRITNHGNQFDMRNHWITATDTIEMIEQYWLRTLDHDPTSSQHHPNIIPSGMSFRIIGCDRRWFRHDTPCSTWSRWHQRPEYNFYLWWLNNALATLRQSIR